MSPRSTSARPERGPSGYRRRRHARRVAIDVLYEADILGRKPAEVLEEMANCR